MIGSPNRADYPTFTWQDLSDAAETIEARVKSQGRGVGTDLGYRRIRVRVRVRVEKG